VVACLRNMTAEEILEGSKNMPSGVLQWSPVIDGVDVIGVFRVVLRSAVVSFVGVSVLCAPLSSPSSLFYSGCVFTCASCDASRSPWQACLRISLPRALSSMSL
jgi:hypothetical protein